MVGLGKAVFLDLDGVLFELVDHDGEFGVSARVFSEVHVVEGLSNQLQMLVRLGFILVGVTNQPDIARGKITQRFLTDKHKHLLRKYPEIKEVFVCTHTESDLCNCRKPKAGLLRQAGNKYNLDFSQCWVVGDSRGDIEVGMMVHARTIFVQTPYNCGDPAIDKATQVTRSTRGALQLIVDVETKQRNRIDT